MRLIGYWMNDLRQSLCLPQEFVRELPEGVRPRVATYLREGVYCRGFGGVSWCRFFCDCDKSAMGCAELTDGEWSWPEGLVHYVETHGITLPDEFIQRALALGSPPSLPDLRPDTGSLESEISLDYWIGWCAQHRSGHLRQRISEAKLEDDKTVASFTRHWCSWQISKYGLADHLCVSPGCEQKAMRGRKYCCQHGITRSEHEAITAGCYPLTRDLVA